MQLTICLLASLAAEGDGGVVSERNPYRKVFDSSSFGLAKMKTNISSDAVDVYPKSR